MPTSCAQSAGVHMLLTLAASMYSVKKKQNMTEKIKDNKYFQK